MGFKSQADIDAAYQSGYTAGVAAGVTVHTGTYNITTNGTTDLGIHHTYRYINTNVVQPSYVDVHLYAAMNCGLVLYYDEVEKIDYSGFTNFGFATISNGGTAVNMKNGDGTYILNPTDRWHSNSSMPKGIYVYNMQQSGNFALGTIRIYKRQ